MSEPVVSSAICPACQAPAELEEEDGLRKFVCTDQDQCGFEFGFAQLSQDDPDCQLGIPEPVRRRASRTIDIPVTLTEEGGVFFGMKIGRRPE